MLDVEPVYVEQSYQGKLVSTGSILTLAAKPRDLILGSGLIRDQHLDGAGICFYAVRGPLTRARIRNADVPQVFGDPALLLPRFYTPAATQRRYGLGLVPHYVDQDVMKTSDPGIAMVDVTNPDWCGSVDLIAACDVVISSSLHGVILAEAYGVPAIWVEASDRVIGSGFKFHDYYASTDREAKPASWPLELGNIAEQAMALPDLDLQPLLDAADQVRSHLRVLRTNHPGRTR